jgi:hypothetical protein
MAVLALAVTALLPLCGCPWFLSIAEMIRWEGQLAAWRAEAENWPDVSVRIVNNTDAAARVALIAAGEAPTPPGGFPGYPTGDPYYEQADQDDLLVSANGTATGTVKCGGLIGITATAPLDLSLDSSMYGWGYYDLFGLYIDPGNVTLSGVGVSGPDEFTGDTLALVWFVRPTEDGPDCTSETLVITIESLGAASVVDEATGQVTSSATPGTAVVSIE